MAGGNSEMTSALTIWIDSSLRGNSARATRIANTQCCIDADFAREGHSHGRETGGQRSEAAEVDARRVLTDRAVKPCLRPRPRHRGVFQLREAVSQKIMRDLPRRIFRGWAMPPARIRACKRGFTARFADMRPGYTWARSPR